MDGYPSKSQALNTWPLQPSPAPVGPQSTFNSYGGHQKLRYGRMSSQQRHMTTSRRLGAKVLDARRDGSEMPKFGDDGMKIRQHLARWRLQNAPEPIHTARENRVRQDAGEVQGDSEELDDGSLDGLFYGSGHSTAFTSSKSPMATRFKPGCLIGHYRDHEFHLGMLTYILRDDLLVLSGDGSWHSVSATDSVSSCDFLDQQELARFQREFGGVNHLSFLNLNAKSLPDVPRSISKPILEKMAAFGRDMLTVVRSYATELRDARRFIDFRTEGRALPNDLRAIAARMFGKRDPAEVTAPMMFVANRTFLTHSGVRLHASMDYGRRFQPYKPLDDAQTIIDWARVFREEAFTAVAPERWASDNPLPDFVRKCRRLIEKSRAHRPLGDNGTIEIMSSSLREGNADQFNDEDRRNAQFLSNVATRGLVTAPSGYLPAATLLLRATGMYSGHLKCSQDALFTFLLEIGYLSIEDILKRSVPVALPGRSYARDLTTLQSRAEKEAKNMQDVSDTMADLRHDWGDLPAFCIDKISTVLRDDAISLEPVLGEHNQFWLHVHVSHASSQLSPEASISRFALEMGVSVYAHIEKHNLLPQELAVERMSLASNRPCMTYSTKITAEGEILGRALTPGFIRNVIFVDPSDLRQEFDSDYTEVREAAAGSVLQVGEVPQRASQRPMWTSRAPESRPLQPAELDTIRLIFKLTDATETRRRGKEFKRPGSLFAYTTNARFDIQSTTVPDGWRQFSLPSLRIERISVTGFDGNVTEPKAPDSDATEDATGRAIEECMLQASLTNAAWCKDRGVPVIYRGHLPSDHRLLSPPEFWEKHIFPRIGKITNDALFEYFRIFVLLQGPSVTSATPIGSVYDGGSEFCYTTSPLRRVADLINQWQVDAALRYEHSRGVSLLGKDPSFWQSKEIGSVLPFTFSEVERRAYEFRQRQLNTLALDNACDRMLKAVVFHDAFYFHRESLPKTFRARVAMDNTYQKNYVRLLDWTFQGNLSIDEDMSHETVEPGQVWEVEVLYVVPFNAKVSCGCRLVRKLSEGGSPTLTTLDLMATTTTSDETEIISQESSPEN